MSMPSFPPNGADMTREEALTMIIASIAMEELALSHILNAEGEKLQYISQPCLCPAFPQLTRPSIGKTRSIKFSPLLPWRSSRLGDDRNRTVPAVIG